MKFNLGQSVVKRAGLFIKKHNMENEIWKPVVGYEGKYEVSNMGRVKSLKYYGWYQIKILKPIKTQNGYLRVHLAKNGIFHKTSIHRIVAEAFIPNPDNLPLINHKNEDKTDNRVENLEWCSWKYNNNYGTRNKRLSESQKKRWAEIKQKSL